MATFLFEVVVLLKDIPSTGLDIWTDLKARSERSKVEGQLHLRLSLATREERDLPEDERQFETKQHCDLMTIFIDHELRKSQVSLSIFPFSPGAVLGGRGRGIALKYLRLDLIIKGYRG